MTILDALTMSERDTRSSVLLRISELKALAEVATSNILSGSTPSTVALEVKSRAVSEAVDIWAAVRVAQRRVERRAEAVA